MFSSKQKLIASSICHIFETSKPLGNPTTLVVLNDGAGITYGIPQATHKSGNLLDVVQRYLAKGANLPSRQYLINKVPLLRRNDFQALNVCASDVQLKRTLRDLGSLPEMREAQLENVWSRMNKAERICAGSGFVTTLALAVIYDSLNHGSFEKIRDITLIAPENFANNLEFEKAWIKKYIINRDQWLRSIPRLAPTIYRTAFFAGQIKANNWNLNLPLNVHGFNLTESIIRQAQAEVDQSNKISSPVIVTKAAEVAPDLGESGKPEEGTEPKTAPSSEETNVFKQEAENIINSPAPEQSAEAVRIEAANAAPPVQLPETEPTDFIGKVKKTAYGVLTGTIALPFLDKVFGVQLSAEQIQLLKFVFPYLFAGVIGSLMVWYVTKKINNFKVSKLIADKNADVTSRNIQLVPRRLVNIKDSRPHIWKRVKYAITAKPAYLWNEDYSDSSENAGEQRAAEKTLNLK